MKHLARPTWVLLVLSLAWFGGAIFVGSADISQFRSLHDAVGDDEYYRCRQSQQKDCAAARDQFDNEFTQDMQNQWITILAIATIPPVLMLLLSWFFFERRRQASSTAT